MSLMARADRPLGISTLLGTVETAWLFTRGPESVRIVRAAKRNGPVHLHVRGPGTAAQSHSFDDVMECMQFQAELERRLVAQGFALEVFTSDRRSSDRSRPARRGRRQP